MNTSTQRLTNFIVQGWTMMFIVYVANLTMDMTRCAVADSCATWSSHIGMGGAKFITVIMVVYTVMPMLIRAVTAKWFRYVVIAMSVLITLFYIAHELSHLAAGDKPFGIFHALDITHHILGVSVIVAASLWARQANERDIGQQAAQDSSQKNVQPA